eukprot:358514-Chlamydomonas_euryale.AAC.4
MDSCDELETGPELAVGTPPTRAGMKALGTHAQHVARAAKALRHDRIGEMGACVMRGIGGHKGGRISGPATQRCGSVACVAKSCCAGVRPAPTALAGEGVTDSCVVGHLGMRVQHMHDRCGGSTDVNWGCIL